MTTSFGSLGATRLLHTMLRVRNLEASLAFYTEQLGMSLFRREDYPEGRFTLAFLGYGDERENPAIELTYNWDTDAYDRGTAFGHIAVEVCDLHAACSTLEASGVRILRVPGPFRFASPQRLAAEVFAFVEDPDGYPIEVIERKSVGDGNLHSISSPPAR